MVMRKLEDRIYTYSSYLRKAYRTKVFRIGLSIGKECPHRINSGGCVFCKPETFVYMRNKKCKNINKCIKEVKNKVKKTYPRAKFFAYFQDGTSTAGDKNFLAEKYKNALQDEDVIGLIVSTRPDFIDNQIIDIFKKLSYPVEVEIGLQSIHEKSLEFLAREHSFKEADNAIELCGKNKLRVGVHIIIGIPGEDLEDMKATIKYITENKYINEVKFHNLVAYKDTKLASIIEKKNLRLLTKREYFEILTQLIPCLKGDKVITRLFTTSLKEDSIYKGQFKGNKTEWLTDFKKYLFKKNITQGSKTSLPFKCK